MGYCEDCKKSCECSDCVRNPNYAINTPKPCPVDCDICSQSDMAVLACSHYLSIRMVNERIRS